jgi:predicted aspartyl protease
MAKAAPNSPLNSTQSNHPNSTTISFDGANDLIVVNAKINGKGPFRFLLDTGASIHLMTPSVAQSLGLRVEGEGTVDTGGTKGLASGLVQVGEVGIGDFTLRKQTFAVAQLPAAYPAQGFIGAQLFKSFVVRIDFSRSQLTLSVPARTKYQDNGVMLRLALHQGLVPQLTAQVDGITGSFKLDTGYNGALALFGKFIDEHHLVNKYNPRGSGTGTRTLTEETSDVPVAQIKELQLGDLKMRDINTMFSLRPDGSNSVFAGAIGTGILKQFIVVIDYRKGRLILQKE